MQKKRSFVSGTFSVESGTINLPFVFARLDSNKKKYNM